MMQTNFDDIIIAQATPEALSAIALIRLTGKGCVSLCNRFFKGKNLENQATHTLHFGKIIDTNNTNTIIDEVVVSLFLAPQSYTMQDTVEIACHGSPYIVKTIMALFLQNGARLANAGEFTMRSFLNGRLDLSQAEAVADLIASESATQQSVAIKQLRGGFSNELQLLRTDLIHFASLIELELDFGEEDVEFADRAKLDALLIKLSNQISKLTQSFQLGNVIKNGVSVVIAGKPNAGKSTLLNALLNEERAIVSAIAGTTRDTIEDTITIEGILFRFIDTAGLRHTTDEVEKIGVERSYNKIKTAHILLYLFDASEITNKIDFVTEIESVKNFNLPYILLANKSDLCNTTDIQTLLKTENIQYIAAKQRYGIDNLKQMLLNLVKQNTDLNADTIVTNLRHFEALTKANAALQSAQEGLKNKITHDYLAADIRYALRYIGEITGEIYTDDLLDNIFSKFCIGK